MTVRDGETATTAWSPEVPEWPFEGGGRGKKVLPVVSFREPPPRGHAEVVRACLCRSRTFGSGLGGWSMGQTPFSPGNLGAGEGEGDILAHAKCCGGGRGGVLCWSRCFFVSLFRFFPCYRDVSAGCKL